MKKFVTIKDVARVSGYSINTVSRALNNKPEIKKETKDKILKVAEELGYFKNFAAASLRGQKTKTIGVVIPDSANPFYSEVLKGIEGEAKKCNYQIILTNTERDYKNERESIFALIKRRIDGLLISPVQERYDDIEELIKLNIPFVILGRHFEEINVDEVYNDEIKGGYIATEYLIKKGHKRILMLNGYLYKSPAKMRFEGYKKALNTYNIPFDPELVVIGDIDFADGYAQIKEVLGSKKRFDAIFAYNDMLALGAIKALKEHGLKTPDDVAVVGYDDILFASISAPALTTVRIKKGEMGQRAFNLLMERIDGRKDVKKEVLDVELIVRESA